MNRMKIICNITRCCTENCTFCAVDALCPQDKTSSACAQLNKKEVANGGELSESQWMGVFDNMISGSHANNYEIDLSGGDCLALPWVWQRAIPSLIEKLGPENVAVTAPATSLKPWLEMLLKNPLVIRPKTIHVTYDGSRQYGNENLVLLSLARDCHIDIHVECPISVENSLNAAVIYHELSKVGVSEIALIRYFPTGRGLHMSATMEPSPEDYRKAIINFLALEARTKNGPRVKLQCALKGFHPESSGVTPCKMGCNSLCVMPNGTLLTCPWAYGMGGQPLDPVFVAGNLAQESFLDCFDRVSGLSDVLRKQYPTDCRVCGFVAEQRKHKFPSMAQNISQRDLLDCPKTWGVSVWERPSGNDQASIGLRTAHPQQP